MVAVLIISKMATKKKRAIAKFTGVGFKLKQSGEITHNSKILYFDRESYLEAEFDNTEFIKHFAAGIAAALKNPRVDPASIRITCLFLEK